MVVERENTNKLEENGFLPLAIESVINYSHYDTSTIFHRK